MTKKRKTKADSLVLEYSLADLPTAQHKTGLAGMILHIQSLQTRKVSKPVPEIVELGSASATLRISAPQLQTLFDDLYEPVIIKKEIKGKSKVQGKKQVIELLRPRGRFLENRLGANSPWLNTWRDMVTSVLRVKPRSLLIYKNAKSRNKAVEDLWSSLVAQQEGKQILLDVKGYLSPGTREYNEELVPFHDVAKNVLLLHFWQAWCPVYVPRYVRREKVRNQTQFRLDSRMSKAHPGPFFILVVAEIRDLAGFIEELDRYWLRVANHNKATRLGFTQRPEQAIVDLPVEAGLGFVLELASQRVEAGVREESFLLDVYLMEQTGGVTKEGKLVSKESLYVDGNLAARYNRLRQIGNPHFKVLCVNNLIRARTWHTGANYLFSREPWQLFLWSDQTPRDFRFFGMDVHAYFKGCIEEAKREDLAMNENSDNGKRENKLARRVYYLLKDYVRQRTKDKTKKDESEFPKDDNGHVILSYGYRDYLKNRERVVKEAFFAMRARRDADFVEYFTGSICAVPHFLPEEDYLAVSRALVEDPATVKNLAMLALSAHSWTPEAWNAQSNGTD